MNVAVIVATGVNADGHREILGIDLITTEDGPLDGVPARSRVPQLSGVALVVSDAHRGSSTPSPRCSPAPPGDGAGPTSCATY